MKKQRIILATLVFIIIANIDISCKSVKGQDRSKPSYDNFYKNKTNLYSDTRYMYHEEMRDSMKYGIWSLQAGYYETGYTIAVVNLTKEKLEVELLKLQIKKLK